MKGLILASGTEPYVEDFNVSLSQQTQQAIKERLSDYVGNGVVHSESGGAFEMTMTPNILDQTRVDISFGVAYFGGERIVIDANVLYDPTNPSKTDPGSGKPTPQSTGNIAVPLVDYTLNALNYIWIQYLQTIDVSQISIHPITSEKFFTRQTDGYQVIISTINDPIITPLANAVYVGSVKGQGIGNPIPSVNISYTNRTYALLKFQTVKTKTPKADRSDAVTAYGAEELHVVDDHVRSIGTGTITPVNPHGLTLADLGIVSSLEPLNELYQKETHDNKIIMPDATLLTSGLYPQIIIVDPGNDFLNIQNLAATETVYVNGIRKAAINIMSGVNPITISFAGQLTNTYYGYLDNSGNVAITTDYANTVVVNKYLPLFAVNWLPFDPAGGGGNIRNPDNSALRTPKDLRAITGENNTELRFTDPLTIDLFPGRRWLNLADGQVKTVKDNAGTIVIMA
jgi:hypothetical protein